MGTLLTVLVLILTGIGFALGWTSHRAASSRRAAAAEDTLAASASGVVSRAYNDGFRAGYRSALAAAGASVSGEQAPARQAGSAQATAERSPGPPSPSPAPAAFSPPVAFGVSAPSSSPSAFGTPAAAARPVPPPSTPLLPGPPPGPPAPDEDRFRGSPEAAPPKPLPWVQPDTDPVPSPEQLAGQAAAQEARKLSRDLRNINITLYAACLLLVAAASLFIGLAIPEGARFAGVTLVAGLFYAGGLVIHARSGRLRPAAVAFTGTGLALIPVVGLALHNLVLHDAPLAWLGTSATGTAAFAYAAARLDSRVVAYLSMTFLLSTALASGASMRSGIIWYFLFTVLLATAVSLVAMRRPAWLGNIYLDAFVRAHRYLVPAAAAVALLTAGELGGWQFSFLFLGFSCYYAVVYLQSALRERLYSSYGCRAAATVGLTALTYMITEDTAAAVLALALLLLVQAAGLLALRRRYSELAGEQYFDSDYVFLIVLQILAGLAAGQSAAGWLPGGSTGQVLFTATAAAVLLTCMAGAWAVAGVPEALPAGAALLGFLGRLNGETGTFWPAVVLGALLTGYYSVRAVRSSEPAQQRLWLWARGAAAVLAAVVPLAVLEGAGADDRETWTWALAAGGAALILNQLGSVLFLARGRSGKRVRAGLETVRRETPVLAATAGGAALLALWLRYTEHPEAAVTLWVMFSALSVNVLTSLVLRPFFRRWTWFEWIGPAGFAGAALLGADLLGMRGYEVLAAGALAYSMFMAVRGARVGCRGGYLLAGQGLLSVLVGLTAADLDYSVHEQFMAVALSVVLQQVLRALLQDRIAGAGMDQFGTTAQWGSVGILVLLAVAYGAFAADPLTWVQPVLLLMAAGSAMFIQLAVAGRRAGGRPVPFAGVSLAAAAALVTVLTAGLRLAEDPQTILTLWVLFAALAVNVLVSLVLFQLFAERYWLERVTPAAFAAAGVLGAGLLGIRGYETLTVAALGYCAFMVVRGARPGLRGGYLLAGQVLLAVLTALVAADLDLTVHGTFIAVALVVAGQQAARTLLQGRYGAAGLGWLGAVALWGSAGVLILLPLVYAVVSYDDTQRHVVVICLSLLLAMAAAVSVLDRNAEVLYPAVYAVGMLPLVLTDVFAFGGAAPLSLASAGVVLLVLAAAALAGETRSNVSAAVRNPALAGLALFCALAFTLGELDGQGLLTGMAVLLPAAAFLAVSFTRGLPLLTAATVALVPAAAFLIQSWFVRDVLMIIPHPAAARLGSGFTAALLLYAAGYVLSILAPTAGTVLRRRILASGAAVIAAGAGVSAMPYDHISAVYGSVVLAAAVAAAVLEFPPARRELAGEAAALVAALAVQRIIWYVIDGADWFWFLQYWVVILAALAAYEYSRGRAPRGTAVLSASAALLSCTGLTSILSADTGEQVWALLAHAGLLAFGVTTDRRLFTVWGAAGVALAVLWYLRGYTFLLLALLAAALIALAVWRLTRVRSNAAADGGN
ncbi:hypothetical protein OL239_04795 [Arthrobacter sp. ATA002]|uniref:hypothetical protein n=1 Tax=Arthrobacter sp. ATA002 TaxID=2991715 RepID=UPI0022A77E10|nr:hypothetical protein [Arthrobacter sp. ATA002]WAP52563.1 hypothetical protein OL239_04795 [Arthrobacter sp. ATA002]